MFIVGSKGGKYLFPYPTHGFDSLDGRPYYTATEAVKGADISEVEIGLGGRFGYLLKDIPPGLNYSFYTREMGYPNPIFSWRSKFSDYLYKADPDTPVRTIKAQGGQYTGPFSWENRKFSLAELKRLQTIPDDYEIVGNKQVAIEQIGNSVPPQLGRILALSILEQVIGINLPFNIPYLPETKNLSFRQRKKDLTKIYHQKAQVAIKELCNAGKLARLDRESETESLIDSVRFLSLKNFAWTQTISSNCLKVGLNYQLNSKFWDIAASTENNEEDEYKFCIDIYPCHGYEDWCLKTKMVKLCAKQLDPYLLTSLWKFFEEKLYELTGKVDLVQLSGYYQYKSRITSSLIFNLSSEVSSFWRIVQLVVRGIATSTQLTTKEFAELWGVNKGDVLEYLQSLKDIGYEVRSHNTNPQIPRDEYLIPYVFPTLKPQSVQLRKKL
ncbi:MAG: hypothetical protein N5P05_000895 [Chroococcopsis gigantea SAG 12.99]|nr:hypothetical protein [Chroococcopsis gigantea SAG 12.99]